MQVKLVPIGRVTGSVKLKDLETRIPKESYLSLKASVNSSDSTWSKTKLRTIEDSRTDWNRQCGMHLLIHLSLQSFNNPSAENTLAAT